MEIIAEIGKNFCVTKQPEPLETLLERAKTLILEAKKAGADTVKFQAHNYEDEVHPEAHLTSPHFDQDRYEWVKRNTYPREFWEALANYCHELDIEFLCTPMSRGAAYLVEDFVDRWKVGSGDLTDFVLLDYLRDYHKPIIISTGMSSLQEIRKAYDFIREKTEDVTILHAVSNYPCKLEDLNLLTIPFLKKQFPEATIGFSDHSLGIEGSLCAILLGAEVIEKHFSLDRDTWGSDHKVSLLPTELKALVLASKHPISINRMLNTVYKFKEENMKKSLGVETKFINEDEMQFRKVFRKGLYSNRDIKKGELIAREDIIALRPRGNAPKSEEYALYVDKVASKNFQKYEALI